jgi:hypothetical protein
MSVFMVKRNKPPWKFIVASSLQLLCFYNFNVKEILRSQKYPLFPFLLRASYIVPNPVYGWISARMPVLYYYYILNALRSDTFQFHSKQQKLWKLEKSNKCILFDVQEGSVHIKDTPTLFDNKTCHIFVMADLYCRLPSRKIIFVLAPTRPPPISEVTYPCYLIALSLFPLWRLKAQSFGKKQSSFLQQVVFV